MASTTPRVTVGIPVYNGATTIRSTIESVLAQTYTDFEVLVVDNASTDGTTGICEEIARSDSRVRHIRNAATIPQDENFTKVYQLAQGALFRWMGDDDTIEPGYLDAVVAAMDEHPEASMVTTYQRHVKDDGSFLYDEYRGPRPDSTDPITRLTVMLRLLTGSRLWIDPVYSLVRRSLVATDVPIRNFRYGDQVFACEAALSGPFAHVPIFLASRGWKPPPSRKQAQLYYSLEVESGARASMRASSQRLIMIKVLLGDAWRWPGLSLPQRMRATVVIVAFGFRTAVFRVTRYVKRRIRRQPYTAID